MHPGLFHQHFVNSIKYSCEKNTISKNTLTVGMSRWNFVCVPKAWLCAYVQSLNFMLAWCTHTKFKFEIHIKSTISAIHIFRENSLESSRSVNVTTPCPLAILFGLLAVNCQVQNEAPNATILMIYVLFSTHVIIWKKSFVFSCCMYIITVYYMFVFSCCMYIIAVYYLWSCKFMSIHISNTFDIIQ